MESSSRRIGVLGAGTSLGRAAATAIAAAGFDVVAIDEADRRVAPKVESTRASTPAPIYAYRRVNGARRGNANATGSSAVSKRQADKKRRVKAHRARVRG